MKKVIALIFTMCLTIFTATIPTFAAEPTTNVATTYEQDSNEDITPRIVHSYSKTVVKTYSTYPVPYSISYQEYNMSAWFSGTLYLDSVYGSGGNWIATYSGTLSGII